jgi:hypothetical protein
MQRFTIRKKVEGPKKNKVMGGLWGVVLVLSSYCCVFCIQGCGGGEVSGGGTLYMKWGADNKLSQARFTGREEFLFYRNKIEI